MGLLDELSEKMMVQEEEKRPREQASEGDVFTIYEELLKSGDSFPVLFQSKGKDNSLSAYIDGVYVILTEGEFVHTFGLISSRNSAVLSMLSTPVPVKVKSIDRKTKTIYVCFDENDKTRDMIPSEKTRVEREIAKKVHGNEAVRVVGRVMKVEDTRALVNILDLNILGILYVRDWADCFIRSLKDVCSEGDVFQFDIIKEQPKGGHRQRAWRLSRTAITGDLWKSANFSGLSRGDSLVVECVDKPAGKSYWWGKSSRLPGIAIMGDYTERYNSVSGVVKGLSYACTINLLVVDPEDKRERKIRVAPYTIINEDVERYEKFQALKNPKKK